MKVLRSAAAAAAGPRGFGGAAVAPWHTAAVATTFVALPPPPPLHRRRAVVAVVAPAVPRHNNTMGGARRLQRPFGTTSSSSSNGSNGSSSSSSSSVDVDDVNKRVVVTVDAASGVAHVVLNRPAKLNALDVPMFHALRAAALQVAADRSVRAVILRGEGRAFCTGLDVPAIVRGNPLRSSRVLLERRPLPTSAAAAAAATATTTNSTAASAAGNDDGDVDDDVEPNLAAAAAAAVATTTNLAQDAGYLWRQVPVPVICCLHGMCYGGGLQIALGADIRLATPDCRLSVREAAWGLVPDMSATVTMRELLRIDVAKELTFTGRIVTGRDAQPLGLVTRCVDDPFAEAILLAENLVQKSPDALRLAKQLYHATWVTASEEHCLRTESDFQRQLLLSWNQVAAAGRNFGWTLPYFTKKR